MFCTFRTNPPKFKFIPPCRAPDNPSNPEKEKKTPPSCSKSYSNNFNCLPRFIYHFVLRQSLQQAIISHLSPQIETPYKWQWWSLHSGEDPSSRDNKRGKNSTVKGRRDFSPLSLDFLSVDFDPSTFGKQPQKKAKPRSNPIWHRYCRWLRWDHDEREVQITIKCKFIEFIKYLILPHGTAKEPIEVESQRKSMYKHTFKKAIPDIFTIISLVTAREGGQDNAEQRTILGSSVRPP